MKKILLIGLAFMLIIACSKKKDTAVNEELTSAYSVTTMQDVADSIDYSPEEETTYASVEPVDTTHKTTSIAETHVKTEPIPKKDTPKPITKKDVVLDEMEIEYGDFTVQLVSLKDKSRVEALRKKLATPSSKRGTYYADIEEAVVNNEITYRLRLSGSYSGKYARYLGEKIKSEFYEITDVWIVKR